MLILPSCKVKLFMGDLSQLIEMRIYFILNKTSIKYFTMYQEGRVMF